MMKPCIGIVPDEVVTYCTAAQAAIIKVDTQETVTDIFLLNFEPFSLVIDTAAEFIIEPRSAISNGLFQ